jgi:hypothetical protein
MLLLAFQNCARMLLASMLMISVVSFNVFGQSDQEAHGRNHIVGTWKIMFVSPTKPPQFQPIPGVITFTSDGTVLESDGGEVAPTVIPGVPTQYGTTGQGVWRCEGDGDFLLKIIEVFVFGDNTLSATGTLKFKIKLNADGDYFSGPGTFKFVDPKGSLLASGTEDLRGRRIKIP